VEIREKRHKDDSTKQAVGGRQQTESSFTKENAECRQQVSDGRQWMLDSERKYKVAECIVAWHATQNLNFKGMLRNVMRCYDECHARNVPWKTRFGSQNVSKMGKVVLNNGLIAMRTIW
jgi:hypothetical protein